METVDSRCPKPRKRMARFVIYRPEMKVNRHNTAAAGLVICSGGGGRVATGFEDERTKKRQDNLAIKSQPVINSRSFYSRTSLL